MADVLLREKHRTPFAHYHSLRLIFGELAGWARWRKVWKFLELMVGAGSGVEGGGAGLLPPGGCLRSDRWGPLKGQTTTFPEGRPEHLCFPQAKQTDDVYSVHMVLRLVKFAKIFLYFFFLKRATKTI